MVDNTRALGAPVMVVAQDGAPIGPAVPFPVAGKVRRAAATAFSRPADTTAYSVGDLLANSTAVGSVVVGSIDLGVSEALITAAMLRTSNPTAAGALRVHLFSAAPTPSAGDNAAFAASGVASWIGSIDVTFGRQMSDGTAGRGAPDSPIAVQLAVGATTLWYLLEVVTAFTPASGSVITASLEYVPA